MKKFVYPELALPDTNTSGQLKWDLPVSIEELRSIIGKNGSATPKEMEEFLKSPKAKAMPKRVRQNIEKWIRNSK